MNKYLVAIGTSHTIGDCDDTPTVATWADHLADRMGVELHKFGLSGAENIELLQILNEINHEYLDKDLCIGVVADVRVQSNNFVFPKGLFLDYDYYDHTDDGENFEWKKLTGLKSWHKKWLPKYLKHRTGLAHTAITRKVVNRHTWHKFSAATVTIERLENMTRLNDNMSFSDVTNHAKLKHAVNVIQSMLVAEDESKDYKSIFENYQLVCAMKNIVVNKGINFAWWDFQGKTFEGVEEYEDFDSTIYDHMIKLDKPANQKYKGYYCKCEHLNKTGHELIAIDLVKLLPWKI